MDWNDIERLRVEGFTVARRGYDRREVDKFLAALGDWIETDAARDLGDVAVKRKLELVGKSTAQILLATEKESEELRAQTEEECTELRSRAEAASVETRQAADEYAQKVREQADRDARRTGEAAGAKAKGIIERAERRRAQIEAAIAELDARRDDVLRELERLQGELASTIAEHEPGTRPRRGEGREGAERPEARVADPVAKP
jgi:cell division septum initiation protein DivIVA